LILQRHFYSQKRQSVLCNATELLHFIHIAASSKKRLVLRRRKAFYHSEIKLGPAKAAPLVHSSPQLAAAHVST